MGLKAAREAFNEANQEPRKRWFSANRIPLMRATSELASTFANFIDEVPGEEVQAEMAYFLADQYLFTWHEQEGYHPAKLSGQPFEEQWVRTFYRFLLSQTLEVAIHRSLIMKEGMSPPTDFVDAG